MRAQIFCLSIAVAAPLLLGAVSSTHAQAADVISGQTSVLLDTATLSSAASLDLSSATVGAGNLGTGSVAFPINTRSAASNPTTFSYSPATFPAAGSFSGSIEHTGSVLFNNDTVEVGNFSIGFDAARSGGANSGFFVASTTGIAAILFDVGVPSAATATPQELSITADLLVSPEFAGFLLDNSLATADLTGADVGDALVEGVSVPEPASLALLGLSLASLVSYRRVRR